MILPARQAFASLRQATIFWISQAVLLPSLVALGWYFFYQVNSRPTMPVLNNAARIVRPQYDFAFVITDEQLENVLNSLRPRFKNQPPKIDSVDHALRLWGNRIQFDDESLSGSDLYELLLNHDAFESRFGSDTDPLLQMATHGISVATRQGNNSVSHADHLVGTLAEIGTPLEFGVKTSQGRGTVGDLLRQAVREFRLNQREYEWTVLAMAFYVTNGDSWFSKEGQELDFNRLSRRLMRQQQPHGVCYGQHRLYTLTMLLRIDEQMRNELSNGLLSQSTTLAITDYLLDKTRKFYQSQSTQGYWDGNRNDSAGPIPDPTTNALRRRLLATGHALEWWAMAPQQLHPPRETIVRAAQWLTTTINELDDQAIVDNYTILTHAARSLVLWRGCSADEFAHRRTAKTNTFDSIRNR